jgi:putative hemolysin
MSILLCLAIVVLAAVASLYFSTIALALRDFSRSRLADYLGKHDGDKWFEVLTERTEQCAFSAAVCALLANIIIWISLLAAFEASGMGMAGPYGLALVLGSVLSLMFAVAVPHAVAKYAAEPVIGSSAPLIVGLRLVLWPLVKFLDAVDATVRQLVDVRGGQEPEQIEQEILSVVEEGEKEGVVDQKERELIENVIEFGDTTAGHIMTGRPQIVGIEANSTFDEARDLVNSSGHSRLPVFEESLDKIIGIFYGRDLIKYLGHSAEKFDLRSVARPAMFIPETTRLQNLLTDFRSRKVHVAIVLDEYGSTAGLVTIEDILEELVGEIADEHEPVSPAMFRKIGEAAAEADGRFPVADLNRQMKLGLPEDAGYETVGGFLMTSLGRIPEKGTIFDFDGARFTVLDAEPQKVTRVKIELVPADTPKV